jgi:hypothetical protein
MSSHWTYSPFENDSDLVQGDIIRRSDELLDVLDQVHRFFCDPRYTAFAILTQSCDLVRRGAGTCKAEHINLAVVRELNTLLPRLLGESCGTGVANVFRREGRYYGQQVLQKILNQNDQAHGLFYLHPDADVGIATPSVILLRVSIALRQQHYDLLKESRCGRLAPEYANKLGWLSGNLYSRIATPDWEDQTGDREASAKKAKLLLAQLTEQNDENWVPQEWVESASKAGIDLAAIPPSRFASTIRQYAPSEPLDIVLDRVREISREVTRGEVVSEIRSAIQEDNNLVPQMIQEVVNLLAAVLSQEQRTEFSELLHGDVQFVGAVKNRIASVVKSNLKAPHPDAIDAICQALGDEVGMTKPAMDRIKLHATTIFAGQKGQELVQFTAAVSAARLFSEVAVDTLRQISEAIVTPEIDARIDAIVKRLRNDQKVKAVFRKSITAAAAPLISFD